MTDYDLGSINDKEFESLCCDIISYKRNITVERFKPGKDSGVDGRFFSINGEETILQCKHWKSTSTSNLINYLNKVESEKVKKLNPKKYFLFISKPLSRLDKTKIKKIFSPYILSESDIYGNEDINDAIRKNRKIEINHYKLWIKSSHILVHLINKAIEGRSASLLEEIASNSHKYTKTDNHKIALELLENIGCIIITGSAGIGKTTLAEQLILDQATKGFSLLKIESEISEAEATYNKDERQVFYFDDFLGRNYLQALTGHEGSHIVNFINRISRDSKKRFILTSRTTVLNQGKLLNDIFNINKTQKNEYEIKIESYQRIDKARILYNQIWHSNLPTHFIREIYSKKRYLEIIDHKNYNPRLISFITDHDRLDNIHHTRYWDYILEKLNNPELIWDNTFTSQTDDYGRIITILATLNGQSIFETDLNESFQRLLVNRNQHPMRGTSDFKYNLRHLCGSLLNRTISNHHPAKIELFNPSLGDYILRRYSEDIPVLKIAFSCLRSSSSLRTLKDLLKNNFISEQTETDIASEIFELAAKGEFRSYTSEYIACICNLLLTTKKNSLERNALSRATEFIVSTDCPFNLTEPLNFIIHQYRCNQITTEQATQYFLKACTQHPNQSELEQLGEIFNELDAESKDQVQYDFEEAITEHYIDVGTQEFNESSIFDVIDPREAKNSYIDLLCESISQIIPTKSDDMINEIADSIDFITQFDEWHSYEFRNDEQHIATPSRFATEEIEDLFDRNDLNEQ